MRLFISDRPLPGRILGPAVIMLTVCMIVGSVSGTQAAKNECKTKVKTFQPDEHADGCTIITVGKRASADGSVMTSHTCDSHRTRAWMNIIPAKNHKKGSMVTIVKRTDNDTLAMPAYQHLPIGEIPQVEYTHGFINTAYPCMNDAQLAIGESTFGGRASLKSDVGLIDCQQLVQLLLERCTTAREAVKMAGALIDEHGWIDEGECLSICDPNEAWHIEIVGLGKGKKGAIWAAQRVPDDHISVNANASRIRFIDFDDPDYFIASKNVTTVAQDSGWWSPKNGPFEFCYAYDPEGRTSFAATRREWRVFDLCAPSLKLHANSENFPFSIKPDTLVTLEKMVSLFQDYYEGTDYNMVKNLTWITGEGATEISPLANPFMPYDMNKLLKINGGWSWRGERTIARWYTMYATITQSRDWLPNEVGGVVWLALDNVAASIYVPIYCSVTDLAEPYKAPGRVNGYSLQSGWWAFNRLGTLTAQRWGDMRKDVTAVWKPMQKELFANQKAVEEEALKLFQKNPKKAKSFLTDYSIKWGNKAVDRAWKLGDALWTKYDELF